MTRRLQRSLQLLAVAAIATSANGAAAKQPPVTWLVFVDDLHLDFRNTGRIRDVVRTVLRQLPAEGETIAMFSSGPSNISVMPTTDRSLLNGQTKMITGSSLKIADVLAYGPDGLRELQGRAAVALSRLVELVGRVTGGTEGPPLRPAIIYVSNGYVTGAQPPLKMNLSPPIFALDPRPLMPGIDLDRPNAPDHVAAMRNSLRTMAEASGGFLNGENESLDAVIARIARVMRP
jgi:hypothetical protein